MVDNLLWFILCIYFEARGEPLEGKVAVGHVIMNRVEHRDASMEDIVKSPYQFSWLNPGAVRPVLNDFAALSDCIKAGLLCLSERMEGKDYFEADHYFGDYIPMPSWAKQMKYIGKIGHHFFYRGHP